MHALYIREWWHTTHTAREARNEIEMLWEDEFLEDELVYPFVDLYMELSSSKFTCFSPFLCALGPFSLS
jgi:hypothetical protein